MAKKHQFHCAMCNSECMIYRKGKKHRVLVCPTHGVLATNPFHLGGVVGKVAKVARTLPFGETIATGLEEAGILAKESPKSPGGVSGRISTHRLNALDWADKALQTR